MPLSRLTVLPAVPLLISTLLAAVLMPGCVDVKYPVTETYVENIPVTENRTASYDETATVTTTVSGEEQLVPYMAWSSPVLIFKGNKRVWYYGFRLPDPALHTSQRLSIYLHKPDYYEYSAISIFDMAPRGQVMQPLFIAPSDPQQPPPVAWSWLTKENNLTGYHDWMNLANIKFNYARFIGAQSDLWLNRYSGYSIEFDPRDSRDIAVVISAPTIAQNARFSAFLKWTDIMTENVTMLAERQVPFNTTRQVEKQRTIYKTRSVPFWEAPPFK
jgi:hypothetical protein